MNPAKEITDLRARVTELERIVDRWRIRDLEELIRPQTVISTKPVALPAVVPAAVSTAKPTVTASNEKRKLVLWSDCSPGDIVMLTAAVRDLHLNHPGRFLTDVKTTAMQIWENNPFVTKLEGWREEVRNTPEGPKTIPVAGKNDVTVLRCDYPLISCSLDLGPTGPNTGSNHSPHHFIHGYIRHLEDALNIRIKPTLFKGDIHISATEKSWMSSSRASPLRTTNKPRSPKKQRISLRFQKVGK